MSKPFLMDRDEAAATLSSESDEARLSSARWYADNAVAEDLGELRTARSRERVRWVSESLDEAIGRAASVSVPSLAKAVTTSAGYSESVGALCNGIVHELRSVVGSLRAFASKELADAYSKSRTRDQIDRLRDALVALRTLGDTDRKPASEEFDLAALIVRESSAITAEEDYEADSALWVAQHSRESIVLFTGRTPYLVRSDPTLVELALRNSLVNAIEATLAADAADEVVVNWGSTDTHHWFSVIDRGEGLPPSPQGIWAFGASTKAGHLGVGLNLVYQAAQSLGADVELSSEGGSTRFYFEWPKHILEPQE